MMGEDADGVAEEAAFCSVQAGVEAEAGVAFVFKAVHGSDFGIDDLAAGIDAASENLDGDIFGGEGIEENSGGDFDFVGEIDFV